MSLALGLKALHRVHTLGQKAHLIHSMGKKLGRLGHSILNYHSPKPIASVAGEGINNMIYNKSNLGDAQYIPLGLKRIVPTKKSSLEKR